MRRRPPQTVCQSLGADLVSGGPAGAILRGGQTRPPAWPARAGGSCAAAGSACRGETSDVERGAAATSGGVQSCARLARRAPAGRLGVADEPDPRGRQGACGPQTQARAHSSLGHAHLPAG